MKQVKQVKEWHLKFGVPVGYYPECLNPERAKLRHNILLEEVNELNNAIVRGDIVEAADGIADVLFVALGTACELGLQDYVEKIFDEVHRSNMSKLDENGNPVMREDGKVLKSKLFTPPNIKAILETT